MLHIRDPYDWHAVFHVPSRLNDAIGNPPVCLD
jgi:hypothetical protein